MDKLLLKSKMALFGDTQTSLADYFGISANALSSKINLRDTDFNQREIIRIKERYCLTPEEVDSIFFAKKVSKKISDAV